MKMFRSLFASLLAFALVHLSVAPAVAATFETLKPVEISAQLPVVAPILPATPMGPGDLSLMAPGLPAGANVAETIGAMQAAQAQAAQPAQAATPAAMATLNVVTGQLAKAPQGDAVAADAVLSRAIEGSKTGTTFSAEPVIGRDVGAQAFASGLVLADKAQQPQSAPSVSRRDFRDNERGSTTVVVSIILGVVAAVAITIGVIWHNAQKKNDEWQNSKSNQEIVLVERARRANDAETLYKIGQDARTRQARMNERIADAKSAGSKKVDDKTGDDLGQAKFYAAADGLVGARAEMNHDQVSQDPAKRIGEVPAPAWKQRLADENAKAKTSEFEGDLAVALQGLKAQLGRVDAKDQGLKGDIDNFHKEVPGSFKGRMGEMENKARADLNEFESTDVQPEHALYDQLNGEMRGRVSAKLAAGSAEYQGHLAHLQRLSDADEQLKPALEIAVQIDKDLKDMASHEHNRQFNLLLASQNENVEVDDYDNQGRKTGSHYEDHSGTYKALAASEGAEARASAASAQGGVKALHAILPLLRNNKTLKDEGLASLIPQDPRNVAQNGSVFFDFWIPASWNLFGSLFTESQAGQAQAAFAPILAQLQGAQQLVGERQNGENGWVNGAIDQDLKAQVEKAKARGK